jgi:Zn-dependent protease
VDSSLIQTILIYALPVLFAITVHEAAHGYVARWFGDDTAYVAGRITLNPMKHIDPMGTILVPLLLYFATKNIPGGPFLFGYARPVPVNFGRLRKPKQHMVWVALAGPAANFIQALLWGLGLIALALFGVNERFWIGMCQAGILTNLAMWAFNLFPVPPLDGGRVAVGLLPRRMAWSYSRIEPWGFFIVMALIVAHVIDELWMRPVMAVGSSLLSLILAPFSSLLGS